MFRVLRDTYQFMFLSAVYARYVLGIKDSMALREQLINWMRAHPRGMNDTLRDWVNSTINELSRNPELVSTDDIINIGVEQMAAPSDIKGDKDLIDTLVEAMGTPFGKLNKERVRLIQRAILTPNERAIMKEKLLKAEMCCASCGVPLHDYELVTFTWSSSAQPQMHCYRCLHPSMVACSACHGVTHTDRKFYIGALPQCEQHMPGAKAVPQASAMARMFQEIELDAPLAVAPRRTGGLGGGVFATTTGELRMPDPVMTPELMNAILDEAEENGDDF